MKSHRFLTAAILIVMAIAYAATAQQAAPQNTPEATPVITKEAGLVLVDTVVTDKKGNTIRDLKASDFRVWEDNKEQPVKNFSFENDGSNDNRKHYMVMFFDNSTMDIGDQAKARDAAMKFLDSNTGANRYIAVVDFGGTLRISQNFTTDAARLKDVVRNLKFSAVAPTPSVASAGPVTAPTMGIPQLVNAEADFGARRWHSDLRSRPCRATRIAAGNVLHAVPVGNKGVEIVRRGSVLYIRWIAGVIDVGGLAGVDREALSVGRDFDVSRTDGDHRRISGTVGVDAVFARPQK